MDHVLGLQEFPTECNLSDYPSRGVAHGLLLDCCNVTMKATETFVKVLEFLRSGDEALEVGEARVLILHV